MNLWHRLKQTVYWRHARGFTWRQAWLKAGPGRCP